MMKHHPSEQGAAGRMPRPPRIVYRSVLARDAVDQAEVFHHAVMQGAMAHYSVAEREAWAAALPREACAWSARQALFTTLVASCDSRCVGFLELTLDSGDIETLYVWPSLARRGIGATLLVHAERKLLEHGVSRARINASLVLADSLVRRGWRELGEEWVERGGQRLKRKRLEKTLRLVET